jgi:hypothetical protein
VVGAIFLALAFWYAQDFRRVRMDGR